MPGCSGSTRLPPKLTMRDRRGERRRPARDRADAASFPAMVAEIFNPLFDGFWRAAEARSAPTARS
jgi:hypothetical protein